MLTQSDEFRAHAEECRKLGSRVRGLMKGQYEELARQWVALAERAEWQRETATAMAA